MLFARSAEAKKKKRSGVNDIQYFAQFPALSSADPEIGSRERADTEDRNVR